MKSILDQIEEIKEKQIKNCEGKFIEFYSAGKSMYMLRTVEEAYGIGKTIVFRSLIEMANYLNTNGWKINTGHKS